MSDPIDRMLDAAESGKSIINFLEFVLLLMKYLINKLTNKNTNHIWMEKTPSRKIVGNELVTKSRKFSLITVFPKGITKTE